tara:strand:- start:267 stop:1664 length:1398 start_codon:yes stop_codon:yes gene_type:complete
MIKSIKTFLLVNLLLSVTLSTSIAIIGNLLIEHTDFQTHLDSQLTLSAYTILSFLDEDSNSSEIKEIQARIDEVPSFLSKVNYDMSSQKTNLNTLIQSIQFKIWDGDKVILESYAPPEMKKPQPKTGFEIIWTNNIPWRVFTIYDSIKDLYITVMQRQDFRINLEKKITQDSISIIIIIYPFLGFLVWFIVGRGLESISKATEELKNKDKNSMTPLIIKDAPVEIAPLISELNNLLARLSRAFSREKRFTADAAHELKTPLAALSAQAQVAVKTKDGSIKSQAINNLIIGVNRCSHVIQQLLILNRMEPEASLKEKQALDLKIAMSEIISEIATIAVKKHIAIEFEYDNKLKYEILGNLISIQIMARNIIDNAVKYTQPHGSVIIKLENNDKNIKFIVSDNGPGIPSKLKNRIFERFYRVIGSKESGSGLGLSIVKQIVEIHDAKITLAANNPGLRMTVTFKKST